MKEYPSADMEMSRILEGPYASSLKDRCNGAFIARYKGRLFKVMASDGTDEDAHNWEHVSVSCPHRTPTWDEMCWIKDQFWEPEEVVFQLHPKKSQYVNFHPYCLHMWRHKVLPCPVPPSILVGPSTGEGT